MRSEKLDRKVQIQRSTTGYSPSGEPIAGWAELGVRRARVVPVRGDERFGGDQWVAKEQVEFHIRWDVSLVDLSPLDRVIYPVETPLTDRNTYDIMAVHEIGRHDGFRILAARRADAP
jgi:head-tail adaptor